MSEIIIYELADGGRVNVRLEGESLWLTQEQIADLFQRERSVITKHLRNIFKSTELLEESNVQNLHIAGSDKPVKFYNLDVIIAVGYRVNSKRGTQFRQWATTILRDHLIYVVRGMIESVPHSKQSFVLARQKDFKRVQINQLATSVIRAKRRLPTCTT